MLSAQKPHRSIVSRFIHKILGEDDIIKRSHRHTQLTLLFVSVGLLLAFMFVPEEIKIALPTLPPLVIEEEFIRVEPPKKKKYEIIFAPNTEFIYHVRKPKPLPRIEIPKLTPPPPPPPPPKPKPKPEPKPRPKPTPPAEVPQPVQTVSTSTNQSAFSSSEDTGASGDQVLAELIRLIEKNKHYPKQAQRRGIQGRNFLQVAISKSGKITRATLSQGSGDKMLDKASHELAQKLVGFSLSVPKHEMNVKVPIVYSFR